MPSKEFRTYINSAIAEVYECLRDAAMRKKRDSAKGNDSKGKKRK